MQPVNPPIFYGQAAQLYARTFQVDLFQSQDILFSPLPEFFANAENKDSFVEASRDLFAKAKYWVPFSSTQLRSCFVTALIQRFHEKGALVDAGTMAVQGLDQTAREFHCNTVAERVALIVSSHFEAVPINPLEQESIDREVKDSLDQIYLKDARRLTRRLALSLDATRAELERRHLGLPDSVIQPILEEPRATTKPQEPLMPLEYLEGLIRTRWQTLSRNLLPEPPKDILTAAEEESQVTFLRECQSDFENSFPNHPFPHQEFINKYIEVAAQMMILHHGFSQETGESAWIRGLYHFDLDYTISVIKTRIARELQMDCSSQEIPHSQLFQAINAEFTQAYGAAIRDKTSVILSLYHRLNELPPVLNFVRWAEAHLREKFPLNSAWETVEKEIIERLVSEYAKYKASKLFWNKTQNQEPWFAALTNEEKCDSLTLPLIRECHQYFALKQHERQDLLEQLQETLSACVHSQISLLNLGVDQNL